MEIRNITKEDLPKLAELISCDDLATREDISFEHSAMAIDENGVIKAFVITRQRSLQDFFGGRIPDEIITDDEEYEEGDEYIYRNETEEHFPESVQYEMIYSYETEDYYYAQKCFGLLIRDFTLIWRDNRNPNISETLKMYVSRNFNGIVSDYTSEYE